jgi:hypothetical protein
MPEVMNDFSEVINKIIIIFIFLNDEIPHTVQPPYQLKLLWTPISETINEPTLLSTK